MELAAIIGALFIAVVILLVIYSIYGRPMSRDADSPPVDPDLWEYIGWLRSLEDKGKGAGGSPGK